MQRTDIKKIRHLELTCMTSGCKNKADYRATIVEDGMTLNVMVCHKCYVEGWTLDFFQPESQKELKRY